MPIYNIDKRPFALLCAYNANDHARRFVRPTKIFRLSYSYCSLVGRSRAFLFTSYRYISLPFLSRAHLTFICRRYYLICCSETPDDFGRQSERPFHFKVSACSSTTTVQGLKLLNSFSISHELRTPLDGVCTTSSVFFIL